MRESLSSNRCIRSNREVIAALLILAFCGSLHGQNASPSGGGLANDWLRGQSPAFTNWDLGGQFRARFEFREHFAIPGVPGSVDFGDGAADTKNMFWLFRDKVHLGWKPCAWFSLFAEGRDSFTVNDDRSPSPEADRFDLHQAFVTLGDPKQFPLTAKVGRQELAYGEERLVGAFDWNNLGRVFDAAKLRWQNDRVWVDGFAGRVVIPRDHEFNVANDYDWFCGVYASTKALCPKLATDSYFLGRSTGRQSPNAIGSGLPAFQQGATARDIYTGGLRFKSLPDAFGGWDCDGEFAGQFGDFAATANGPQLEHRAFAAHIAGGYSWKQSCATPRVGLEYNFASGDSDPTDNRHGTFENLFPTNHKFYGFMDFVSWQNIHNVRFTASAKPHKQLTLTADCHLFWLADTSDSFYQVNGAPRTTGGYGIKPGNDSFVGTELDAVATWAIKPYANAQLGYGHFFRGNYVKQSLGAGGSADADFVYVQVLFNF